MPDLKYTVDESRTPGLISRIYVWSLVFESLLFFVIGNQYATGFNITVGKVLQIFVIFLLVLRWLASGRDLKFINLLRPSYKYFTSFFVLIVISGMVGMLSGAYVLQEQYVPEYANTIVAKLIRGSATRPLLEYFVIIYYFAYFTVMPRYLLNSEKCIKYFFESFSIAFVVCLLLGFADLILPGSVYGWIPRDISEGVYVGFRFHGLAGEPRDAFVYLMFGLAVLNLRAYWFNRSTVGTKWIIVVFGAAILTQSASGLVGLCLAVLLMIAFSFKNPSRKNILSLAGILIVISAVVIVSIESFPRLQQYREAASFVYESLEDGKDPPLLIASQMNNIYPLWDLYTKSIQGNVIPLVLGSGLGSSSVINNNLGRQGVLDNPNSQLIRLVYESGVLGSWMLIMAFVYPVKFFTFSLHSRLRRRFLVFTYLLLGSFLAHRSTTLFIYLGIFLIVVNKTWRREYNESRPHRALQDRTPEEFAMAHAENHLCEPTITTGNSP